MKTLIHGHLAKDIYNEKEVFGGPAGSISEFLMSKYGFKTQVHSVLGTDAFSKKYLNFLNEKGIDTSGIEIREGELPAYNVYEDLWTDNVCVPFPRFIGNIQEIETFILATSDPQENLYLIKNANSISKIYYCPGQYLSYMTPDEIFFSEIIQRVNHLQLNDFEYEVLKRFFTVSNLEDTLFSSLTLETILVTSNTKNIISQKNGEKISYNVDIQLNPLDSLGAGDRLFGEFFYQREILKNSLDDSLKKSTIESYKVLNKLGGMYSI